jgi:O-Antigen ligase
MELLLSMCILAALAWGIVFQRLTGLWGCLLATLVTGTIFGHSFFHLSAFTFDRLLLAFCIVLFVLWLFHGKNQPKLMNSGDYVVAFFVAAMALTTFMHPLQETETSPTSKLLFFFLVPVAMYLLASQIKITERHLRWMFVVFAALGVYLSITAVAEKMDWPWAIFPKYIVNTPQTEFLGRGRGPLLNPSGNGILMSLALSSALVLLLNVKGWQHIAISGLVPVYLLGIVCTMTRCVWLGGVATMLACTTAMMPTRWRVPMLVFMSGFATLGLFVSPSTLMNFKRDKGVSVEYMRQSAELRPILAVVAWKMFQDRPLTGCGTGQYMAVAKNHLSDRNVNMPLERARPYVQHNIFLAMLVENGLVTIIPFCVLLIIWTIWALQLWWSQTIAFEHRQLALVFLGTFIAYLCNGVFQDVLIIPMINSYLFFLAGCLRNSIHQLQPLHVWSGRTERDYSKPHNLHSALTPR